IGWGWRECRGLCSQILMQSRYAADTQSVGNHRAEVLAVAGEIDCREWGIDIGRPIRVAMPVLGAAVISTYNSCGAHGYIADRACIGPGCTDEVKLVRQLVTQRCPSGIHLLESGRTGDAQSAAASGLIDRQRPGGMNRNPVVHAGQADIAIQIYGYVAIYIKAFV